MTTFADMTSVHFHETADARFRVLQGGNGPDIVWVPGGDSPAHYWSEQFEFFHSDLRSTAYDPRGAGETTSAPPPWSMKQFGDDCAGIIEAFCSPPVILAGLSMGSLITQQVAIDHPHLVRLAIVMGTSARITGFTRDWMAAEIQARVDGSLAMPPDFAACHYAAFAYPANALEDDALWERIKAAYKPRFADRDPQMLIAQWQACLDYDVTAALADCPVPIHAVAFSEDIQTPPRLVRRVAEAARHGHYHELPGLGHVSLNRHAPRTVNTFLASLIAEHADNQRQADTGTSG